LPGGNFVTLATPFTVVNAGTSTEQTSITLTIDSTKGKTITDVVSALSLTANFYLQSQTCP